MRLHYGKLLTTSALKAMGSQVSTRSIWRRELFALLTLTVTGPVQPGRRSSGTVTGMHVRPTGDVPAVQTVPHVVCAAAHS